MGVNPSDNKFLWMRYFGAGPERALERFQGYENGSGLKAAGCCMLAMLESMPIIGAAISFLDKVCSKSQASPKVHSVVSPLLAIKTAHKKEEKKVEPLLAIEELSTKKERMFEKKSISLEEAIFFQAYLETITCYVEELIT